MKNEILITILLMALATLATRIGGLWLMRKFRLSPFIENALSFLPGSLLTAIVTPSVVLGDVSERLAAVSVILVMLKTKNVLFAMTAGMIVILLVRGLFF